MVGASQHFVAERMAVALGGGSTKRPTKLLFWLVVVVAALFAARLRQQLLSRIDRTGHDCVDQYACACTVVLKQTAMDECHGQNQ